MLRNRLHITTLLAALLALMFAPLVEGKVVAVITASTEWTNPDGRVTIVFDLGGNGGGSRGLGTYPHGHAGNSSGDIFIPPRMSEYEEENGATDMVTTTASSMAEVISARIDGSAAPTFGSTSSHPSAAPSDWPTASPEPSAVPTASPSASPSAESSGALSGRPTASPFSTESPRPSAALAISAAPSSSPSDPLSSAPSEWPTRRPSDGPTFTPTASAVPSSLMRISGAPSDGPSVRQSEYPSIGPSVRPTISLALGVAPSGWPSATPTASLSLSPSAASSAAPSSAPSESFMPSVYPSLLPSTALSEYPSFLPSTTPSEYPSFRPSTTLSEYPSFWPSATPRNAPTSAPTATLSKRPSSIPSATSTSSPSSSPSMAPSISTVPSKNPTFSPTRKIYKATFHSSTAYSVLACRCHSTSFVCVPQDGPGSQPMLQNSELSVCLFPSSTDVVITTFDLHLEMNGTVVDVITTDGVAAGPLSIVSRAMGPGGGPAQNGAVLITTRLRTELFKRDEPYLAVRGTASLAFRGVMRSSDAAGGTSGMPPVDQESSNFGLLFRLVREEPTTSGMCEANVCRCDERGLCVDSLAGGDHPLGGESSELDLCFFTEGPVALVSFVSLQLERDGAILPSPPVELVEESSGGIGRAESAVALGRGGGTMYRSRTTLSEAALYGAAGSGPLVVIINVLMACGGRSDVSQFQSFRASVNTTTSRLQFQLTVPVEESSSGERRRRRRRRRRAVFSSGVVVVAFGVALLAAVVGHSAVRTPRGSPRVSNVDGASQTIKRDRGVVPVSESKGAKCCLEWRQTPPPAVAETQLKDGWI